MLIHWLLACIVFDKYNGATLIFHSLYVIFLFPLASLKILSLSLVFTIFTMACLAVIWLVVFWYLSCLSLSFWTCSLISYFLGERGILSHYLFKYIFCPIFCLPHGDMIIHALDWLMLCRFWMFSYIYYSLFFSLCLSVWIISVIPSSTLLYLSSPVSSLMMNTSNQLFISDIMFSFQHSHWPFLTVSICF